MEVRAVVAEEWREARELRFRALADAPDSFRSTHAEVSAKSDDEWAELVRTNAEHPDGQSWVAEADGVAVGQAFSRVIDGGPRLGIFGMWVAPEARRGGVGRALLEAAELWGEGRGCTSSHLWVEEGNEPAERLYRNAGYHRTGDDQPLREGSALRCAEMSKEL